MSFARKHTGLGFLLAGTLRSHHPEPEELWTLGSEDEFAIRLQGSCLELTALKHWRKGEYRLVLPTTDLVSVTEHLVKKYFPTFQAVFLERNVCLDQENAPDNWINNMGIYGFVQDVIAACYSWEEVALLISIPIMDSLHLPMENEIVPSLLCTQNTESFSS